MNEYRERTTGCQPAPPSGGTQRWGGLWAQSCGSAQRPPAGSTSHQVPGTGLTWTPRTLTLRVRDFAKVPRRHSWIIMQIHLPTTKPGFRAPRDGSTPLLGPFRSSLRVTVGEEEGWARSGHRLAILRGRAESPPATPGWCADVPGPRAGLGLAPLSLQ